MVITTYRNRYDKYLKLRLTYVILINAFYKNESYIFNNPVGKLLIPETFYKTGNRIVFFILFISIVNSILQ